MSTDKLTLGAKAPYFELMGVDGRNYNLDSFASKKALVVFFSCNHCPYVIANEDRLIALQEEFKKDVKFVAINSNDETSYPEDSFENMKIRAEKKQFNFPYLRDKDQSIAEEFGATHTPEIFLFDQNRNLVFHGKIDDNWENAAAAKKRYLRDAIKQALAGEQVAVPETFTIGCTIKWK